MQKVKCVFCYDDLFTSEHKLKVATCGHIFHHICFDEAIERGTSLCPSCRLRLMARHCGPLHLNVEDISDVPVIPARSKSMDSSPLSKEPVENLFSSPLPPKSTHVPMKSSKKPDRNVRIARNHCNVQNNSPKRVGTLAVLPKKPPRKHNQNNRVGRKSGRVTKQQTRFSATEIQCSVCNRNFWRMFWNNEGTELYNEPIACSFKCSRFLACIQKPIQ